MIKNNIFGDEEMATDKPKVVVKKVDTVINLSDWQQLNKNEVYDEHKKAFEEFIPYCKNFFHRYSEDK